MPSTALGIFLILIDSFILFIHSHVCVYTKLAKY